MLQCRPLRRALRAPVAGANPTKVAVAPWRDLPPEILGLVLLRLPSLTDRVRFRAVCRPWRAAGGARSQPLPWLACRDGGLVDLDEHSHCRLCTGNRHVKVVLSSPEMMQDTLIAVVFLGGFSVAISACEQRDAISISMPPDPEGSWSPTFRDIAFLHGKLYVLSRGEGLYAIEVNAAHLSELKSSGFHQCIADDPTQKTIYNIDTDDPTYMVLRYLVESNGRLLLVRRWMTIPESCLRLREHSTTSRFEIFEADLAAAPSKWTKVDNLGGQALFISSDCSKSVLSSQCPGGIQEDCIYFMHKVYDNPFIDMFVYASVGPLADSGVYNMKDGKIGPLLPETVIAELQSKRQFLTWFFPKDA